MKKWTWSILAVFFLGIAVIIFSGMNKDMNDYLKAAENPKATDDTVVFNLEKALEKSREKYGDRSVESADIYVLIAQKERDGSKVLEYFDKATIIYELQNQPLRAAEAQYKKGLRMLDYNENDLSKEAFQSALERYQQEEPENADDICRCYYYLAYSSVDYNEKINNLKMAENLIDDLSSENEKEISDKICVSIANNYFVQAEYENALPYYEKLTGDGPEKATDKRTLADSYSMHGASFIYLGKAEAAEEKLRKAIELYEEMEVDDCYLELSKTYTDLAFSCAKQKSQPADQIIGYGEQAFSYYLNRDTITSTDLSYINYSKIIMGNVFAMVYPEKEEWEYQEWCAKYIRSNANVYQDSNVNFGIQIK